MNMNSEKNPDPLKKPLLEASSSVNHRSNNPLNPNLLAPPVQTRARNISKSHESVLFSAKLRNSSFQYSVLPEKEEHTPHLMITDLAMHFDELAELEQNDMGAQIRGYTAVDMWILLIMLATIVPCISITFSYISGKFLSKVMYYFIEQNSLGYFLLCLLVSLIFAFTGCTICYFFRDAEGSGIPELKSTLAGISIYKYLSFQTLLAKIFGLFFAIGSGLFVGREGPFVHISAAVANNLAKFNYFKRLHSKNTFRKQILATAGGIGITATFGTPIGGCLYSIETMSTFFAVGAFWKAFFCSFICGVVFHVYGRAINLSGWTITKFPGAHNEIDLEIFAFMILGGICGLLGALHVKFIEFLLIYRKLIKNNQPISRYIYTGMTCFVSIFIVYYFWNFGFLTEDATDMLFNSQYNAECDVWWKLLILIFLKLMCNGLGVTCPIPTGIFVPMFLTGGLVGRLYGIIMINIFPNHIVDIGRYAVVGAAALVAGVTHTLAMAVITLEVTGQMALLFPMLMGVISSYYVSRAVTLSVYYVIVDLKDLPFLPKLLKPELYNKNAKDVMDVDFPCLTPNSNLEDAGLVLSAVNYRITAIPVLEEETLELIATVQTANLREYLVKEAKKHRRNTNNASVSGKSLLQLPGQDFYNRLESIPPIHQEFLPKDMKELNGIPLEDPFWGKKVDIWSPILNADKSPFTVNENISVGKLHFLFSMLGLHYVFVLNHGKFVGMITKESFQSLK